MKISRSGLIKAYLCSVGENILQKRFQFVPGLLVGGCVVFDRHTELLGEFIGTGIGKAV
jgi:hypothetical protein